MLARFAAKGRTDVLDVDSLDVFDYQPGARAAEQVHREHTRLLDEAVLPAAARWLHGQRADLRLPQLVAARPGRERADASSVQVSPPRTPADVAQLTQMLQRLRSSNAVPGGAPACLSPRLGSHPRVHVPEQRRVGEPGANTVRDQLATEPCDAHDVPRLAEERPRPDSGAARRRLVRRSDRKGEGRDRLRGQLDLRLSPEGLPDRAVRDQSDGAREGAGNLGFTASYSIGKDSPNKKAAWRLLRFLVGKQGQAVWAKNSGFLPSRSDVSAPAGRANFLREAPYARPWQFVKGFQRVLDFAGKELEATANGDQDVATMLADINRETQDAINKSR